ncbi:MAG: hypothetical protein ACP5FL_03545 [Thermoplasmatota archaeon]
MKRTIILLTLTIALILSTTATVADEEPTVEEKTQSKQWNLISEWSGSLFANPQLPEVHELDEEKKKQPTPLDILEHNIALAGLLATFAGIIFPLLLRANYAYGRPHSLRYFALKGQLDSQTYFV